MEEEKRGGTSGASYDSNALFTELRDRWYKAAPKGVSRSGSDLCEMLGDGLTRQALSKFATGWKNRRPPMWVLMKLCEEMKLELKFNAHSVSLCRKGRGKRERVESIYPWSSEESLASD